MTLQEIQSNGIAMSVIFKSTTSIPLMNHCKEQGHQPSKTVQDGPSKLITCNNCQKDFTSYWNLMNHRKQEHPSNRKCRDFAKGECQRGDLCWYVHDNVMEFDPEEVLHQSEDKVTCYVCKHEFPSKNAMMNHKKRVHPSHIICKNFCLGNCRRSEEQCWYLHKNFPGGVSSEYVRPGKKNTLPQSIQVSSNPWGLLPNDSHPSVGTINENILPQSTQVCSTSNESSSSVSPTVHNDLSQSRQMFPSSHVLP